MANVKQLNLLKDPDTAIYPKIVEECLPDTLQDQLKVLSGNGNINASGTITTNNLNVNNNITASGSINIRGSLSATGNLTAYGDAYLSSLITGRIDASAISSTGGITTPNVVCGTQTETTTYNYNGINYVSLGNSTTGSFSKTFLFEQEQTNSIATFGNSLRLYTGNDTNYYWDKTCDFSFNGLKFRSIILFINGGNIVVVPNIYNSGQFTKFDSLDVLFSEGAALIEDSISLQFALISSDYVQLQYNSEVVMAMLVQLDN